MTSQPGRATVVEPGDATTTVLTWIHVLHRGTADDALWRALTEDLRLTIAQLHLIAEGVTGDDARAARLASAESTSPPMLHRQCQAWRKACLPLTRGIEQVAAVAVGSDMELVTVTGRPARSGGGAVRTPRYRFLVQHRRSTAIAAIGHRLPLPGWPPGQWSIPHLLGG